MCSTRIVQFGLCLIGGQGSMIYGEQRPEGLSTSGRQETIRLPLNPLRSPLPSCFGALSTGLAFSDPGASRNPRIISFILRNVDCADARHNPGH